MALDRTPEEVAQEEAERAYIHNVLDKAAANLASYQLAMSLDEPPDVCEQWVDRMFDDLKRALTPKQRVHAILLLLHGRAWKTAKATVDELGRLS